MGEERGLHTDTLDWRDLLVDDLSHLLAALPAGTTQQVQTPPMADDPSLWGLHMAPPGRASWWPGRLPVDP